MPICIFASTVWYHRDIYPPTHCNGEMNAKRKAQIKERSGGKSLFTSDRSRHSMPWWPFHKKHWYPSNWIVHAWATGPGYFTNNNAISVMPTAFLSQYGMMNFSLVWLVTQEQRLLIYVSHEQLLIWKVRHFHKFKYVRFSSLSTNGIVWARRMPLSRRLYSKSAGGLHLPNSLIWQISSMLSKFTIFKKIGTYVHAKDISEIATKQRPLCSWS